MNKQNFSVRVLNWFHVNGRKDLPWQKNQTPYRVWVSEIMLQQTQVATVIPYYQKFMARFPNIKQLAAASIDEVLQHWSGLGYYARGRNLHRTALAIMTEHAGRFPKTLDDVVNLPGIGRSTAGAILSLSLNQPHAILDGNVKRVLARYFAIEGWPGEKKIESILWQKSEQLTPLKQTAQYNQAMMDIGATVCTRSKPRCLQCPLTSMCIAKSRDQQTDYPGKKAKKTLPIKTATLLLIINSKKEILMERRPPSGIWGGLLSFPQIDNGESINRWCKKQLGLSVKELQAWKQRRHTFSHYHFDISPVILKTTSSTNIIMDTTKWIWYKEKHTEGGIPAPIQKLLHQLKSNVSIKY